MRHPAVFPAIALLVGVAAGVRSPGLSHGIVVSVVGLIWACTVGAFIGGRASLATRCALAGFVSVGMVLGAQANARATATGLWAWYQRQSPARVQHPVLIEGRLTRDQVATEYGSRLDLEVDRLQTRDGWIAVDGGVRVTVGGALAASRARAWVRGRRLRLPVTVRPAARYANPGVPDQRRALMWRGTTLLGSVKSALLVEVVEAGRPWSEAAAMVRAEVRRRVDRTVGHFSRRSSGVVTAVLIGDRAGLGAEARRRLQEGGTYHVIAISGGNIAILSAAVLLLLRTAGCSMRRASAVGIGCLLAYGVIVGAEASVVRATFAATVILGAMAVDHRASPLNTLALAAACLVGASPQLMLDAGFLLTFAATFGIIVGVPPLVGWVRGIAGRARWLRPGLGLVVPIATLCVATLCAELALLPIVATVFSQVTVAGLVLNFAAVPLMTVVQVAGLLAVALSMASEPAARVAAYAGHLAALGILESARLVDLLPWLSWRVAAPGLALTAGYYGGWCLLLRAGARHVAWWSGAGLVGVTGALVLGVPISLPPPSRSCRGVTAPLEVLFLDVDQADATLVKFPSGHSLLVDAGGTIRDTFDVGARIVSPVLWGAAVRRLDYLALSHGDPDHIGGALSVIAEFSPREVWTGVPVPRSERLQALESMSSRVGAGWRVLQKGDRLIHDGVSIEVWHPPTPEWERQDVRNDDSLVIDLRYGRVSVVLPGDIGSAVEAVLSDEIPTAPIRVVKVPHHGSATSSSAEFVAALRPRVAVISAGRHNRFGHPAPEVVRRYRDAGAMVLETGDGAISVCTDGSTLSVTTPVFRAPVAVSASPSAG